MEAHDNLLYANCNGKLISIEDAVKGETYFCPACNDELILKDGDIRKKHFAHKNTENCQCGYQTSLHILAKEIIEEAKEFYLPEISIPRFRLLYKTIMSAKKVKIDRVCLEKRVDTIIPDIIIEAGGKELFVEIYVTHPVDDEKREKIIQLNKSTIEIDLHDCDRLIEKEELREILLNDVKNKKWVYSASLERYKSIIESNTEKKSIVKGPFSEIIKNCEKNKRLYYDKRYCTPKDCVNCECLVGLGNDYVLCDHKDFLKIDEKTVVKQYRKQFEPPADLMIGVIENSIVINFNVEPSYEFRKLAKESKTMFWMVNNIDGVGDSFKDFSLICDCRNEIEFNITMDFLEKYFKTYKLNTRWKDQKNYKLVEEWLHKREIMKSDSVVL